MRRLVPLAVARCDDAILLGPDGLLPAAQAPPRPVTLRRARGIAVRVGVLHAGRLYVTPACSDQLAETRPAPTRLPAHCGR